MAKIIEKIVQSKYPPKDTNVLWDDGENLKISRNGSFENVVSTTENNGTNLDIEVTVDNTTGNPSASATIENGTIKLAFSGLKGEAGSSGSQDSVGEGGIPIVESVEELESLGLPAGSIASVAINSTQELSIRDLYEYSEVDFLPEDGGISTERLSRIVGLRIIADGIDISNFPDCRIEICVPSYISPPGIGEVYFIEIREGVFTLGKWDGSNMKMYYEGNNPSEIGDDVIETINNDLSSNVYYYIGSTAGPLSEDQFNALDLILKAESGNKTSDSYIQGYNKIEKIVTEKEIQSINNRLATKEDAPYIFHFDSSSVLIQEGEIYILEPETTRTLNLRVIGTLPSNKNVGKITCYAHNVSGEARLENLMWENDVIPTLDAEKYYKVIVDIVRFKSGEEKNFARIVEYNNVQENE